MTEPVRRERRPRRKILTDRMVAALPRRRAPYFFPDPELLKHGVRVRPAGPGTFTIIARDAFKRQRWVKIGSADSMMISEAREVARSVIRRVEQGLEPFEPPPVKPDTVAAVVELWLEQHVAQHKLRSGPELRRICEVYILPYWAKRDFVSIKRKDIIDLADHIERKHGSAMADVVTKYFRAITNWFRNQRDETYVPPAFPKDKRVPVEKRRRKRVLNDDELRRVWRAADAFGGFGSVIKLLLLTAQRREKVLTMKWADIAPDGTWTIPKLPREKGSPDTLLLPAQALAIVRAQPRFINNPYVFAGNRGGRKIFNFARDKQALDDASGVGDWVLHDCRRTARSLMSKAGVRSDVAELILGHAVGGVKEIYDTYDYVSEMSDGLRRLAALIDIILAGEPTDDIKRLRKRIDRVVGAPTSNVVAFEAAAS
jgi:integrase